MKVSEKIKVINRICDELELRYSFSEAYIYLKAFIQRYSVNFDNYSSVKDMAFYALGDVGEGVLGEIVDDLGIESLASINVQAQLPEVWKKTDNIRVFISHLAKEKNKAARIRDEMAKLGLSAFVAHEDISPTLEWQVQIERALHNMELFVSVHTSGFRDSYWAQQEVGFAVAKGTKIIAIRMDEDPVGFISKNQALSRGAKRAEQVVKEITELLEKDERTRDRFFALQVREVDDDEIPF
jgi:hypothetical protein